MASTSVFSRKKKMLNKILPGLSQKRLHMFNEEASELLGKIPCLVRKWLSGSSESSADLRRWPGRQSLRARNLSVQEDTTRDFRGANEESKKASGPSRERTEPSAADRNPQRGRGNQRENKVSPALGSLGVRKQISLDGPGGGGARVSFSRNSKGTEWRKKVGSRGPRHTIRLSNKTATKRRGEKRHGAQRSAGRGGRVVRAGGSKASVPFSKSPIGVGQGETAGKRGGKKSS